MLSKLQSKVMKLTGILKRKNETLQKEKENIKTLVSDISHQLKTPISNLKIYVNFLKDKSLTEEKRSEYVEIVCLAVERLNDLSESMIKISRLESGLIQLDMQEQSLNETVLKAVKDVYVSAKNNNNEIIYSKEGIGVGLYLAREIAMKQGGYMNLKSYDNGNIFSIML